jgi:hypothetical protein
MTRYVIESWLLLLYFELVMRFRDFSTLCRTVRKHPTHDAVVVRQISAEQLCHAVDLACVFYFKRVLCLQRSAATTIFLRRYGWKAEMIIGAQVLPFRSHAWVEIDGAVANDKPYVRDIYQALDRY